MNREQIKKINLSDQVAFSIKEKYGFTNSDTYYKKAGVLYVETKAKDGTKQHWKQLANGDFFLKKVDEYPRNKKVTTHFNEKGKLTLQEEGKKQKQSEKFFADFAQKKNNREKVNPENIIFPKGTKEFADFVSIVKQLKEKKRLGERQYAFYRKHKNLIDSFLQEKTLVKKNMKENTSETPKIQIVSIPKEDLDQKKAKKIAYINKIAEDIPYGKVETGKKEDKKNTESTDVETPKSQENQETPNNGGLEISEQQEIVNLLEEHSNLIFQIAENNKKIAEIDNVLDILAEIEKKEQEALVDLKLDVEKKITTLSIDIDKLDKEETLKRIEESKQSSLEKVDILMKKEIISLNTVWHDLQFEKLFVDALEELREKVDKSVEDFQGKEADTSLVIEKPEKPNIIADKHRAEITIHQMLHNDFSEKNIEHIKNEIKNGRYNDSEKKFLEEALVDILLSSMDFKSLVDNAKKEIINTGKKSIDGIAEKARIEEIKEIADKLKKDLDEEKPEKPEKLEIHKENKEEKPICYYHNDIEKDGSLKKNKASMEEMGWHRYIIKEFKDGHATIELIQKQEYIDIVVTKKLYMLDPLFESRPSSITNKNIIKVIKPSLLKLSNDGKYWLVKEKGLIEFNRADD